MRAQAVDISAAWSCPRCPYKHAATARCPPAGAWLVLELCPVCQPSPERYCSRHRGRPASEPVNKSTR